MSRTPSAVTAWILVASAACSSAPAPPRAALPPPRLIGSMTARVRAADSEEVPFERVPAALAATAIETRPEVVTSRIRLAELPEARIPPPLAQRDAPASVPRVRVPPSAEPELVLVGVPDDPPGPLAPIDADIATLPIRVRVTGLGLSEVGLEGRRWQWRDEQVDNTHDVARCGGRGVAAVRAHGVRRRERGDELEYVVVDGWFDRARCAVSTTRRTVAVAAPLVPGVAYAFRVATDGAPETLSILLGPGSIATAPSHPGSKADTTATFTRVSFAASGEDLAESLVALLPTGDGAVFRTAAVPRRGPPEDRGSALYLAIDVVDDGEPVAITAVGVD